MTVKKMIALFMAAAVLASATACGIRESTPDTTSKENSLPEEKETTEETTIETAGAAEGAAENSVSGSAEGESPVQNNTAASDQAEEDRIFCYTNGMTTTEEERNRRPVAIMLNNIKQSLPQEGLCSGDVYYECAAEGGITRIMMVTTDYENLPTVGSIRSSRDYFVDFLFNHDALYVHAGGSDQAYEKIAALDVDNLDGIHMYLPTTFWRDQTRIWNMGYEHSMMTSGEEIAKGIAFKEYRTELREDYVPVFSFYDEETDNQLAGSAATHVHMESTAIQTVDFVYNEKTGEYLRYQYDGMAQVDATTGEQLSVKNVLILFTEIDRIPGDEAGRLTVKTVGSGQGYYITGGQYKEISWSRENETASMHLTYSEGEDVILNCGKTFICVVDDSVAQKIDFEYSWSK